MRTRVIVVWSLACLLFAGTVAHGQSLADIARKEEARRKAITAPGKVYTNQNVRPVVLPEPASPQQTATAVPASSQAAGEPPPAAGATVPPAAPEPQVAPAGQRADIKDEASWRALASDARLRLERSEGILSAFMQQNEVLAGRFAALGDLAQRAQVVAEMQRVQAEIDRVQKEIAAQTLQIAAIEEQARRAGVPPGWIRPPQS